MTFRNCHIRGIQRIPLSSLVFLIACGLVLPESSRSQGREASLEEITVIAQRREQNILDVPIAVSAVSGDVLDKLNVQDYRDLEVPGVVVSEGGRSNRIAIRGIGSGPNSGFEQSVPYFIDGMYLGRARAIRVGFLDTDRVEILRGPQPTYLGKNAIGGAIGLVTRRPTDEFEASIDIAHETEATETNVTGILSGPLGETVNVRLAANYRDMDGWFENAAVNDDWPNEENFSARGSITWDITENFRAYAKVTGYTHEYQGHPKELFNCNPGSENEIDPLLEDCVINGRSTKSVDLSLHAPDSNLFEASTPNDAHIDNTDYVASMVELVYDWDNVSLVSTTAYYDLDNHVETEASHSTEPCCFVDISETAEQLSQELRLQSTGSDRLEWMVGIYFDAEEISTTNLATIPRVNLALNNNMRKQTSDSWSVFGSLRFALTDTLSAKIGGRYADVTKEADYERSVWALPPGSPTLGPQVVNFVLLDEREDSEFTPDVTLEWRPVDGHMYYASYKEGFKAGGFDHSTGSPDLDRFRFEPETIESYELGGKWSLLDGRMIAAVAIFRGDVEDLQVTALLNGEPGFQTTNAAKARTEGLEIDATYLVTENLTISTILSFLDARYLEYPNAQCNSNPAQTPEEGCVPDPITGDLSQDLAGQRLPYAPEFSGELNLDWRVPLAASLFGDTLEFRTFLRVYGNDGMYFQTAPDPDLYQPSYTKFDAVVGLGDKDGSWIVEAFGRNLTDEYTLTNAGNTPLSVSTNNGVLARTRQVGLRLRIDF